MSLLGNSQRLYRTFSNSRQQTPPKTPVVIAKRDSSVHFGSCDKLSAPNVYGRRIPHSSTYTPLAALALELGSCVVATLAAFGVLTNNRAEHVDLATVSPMVAFGFGVLMLVLSARQQLRVSSSGWSYLLVLLSTVVWACVCLIVVVVFTEASPYQASVAAMWAGMVGSAGGYWGVTLSRGHQGEDGESQYSGVL